MDLRAQLKMSHQLVMTPQLQQAIKLLQLSRFELELLINQALVENPVLETEPEKNKTSEEAEFIPSDLTPLQANDPNQEQDWQEYTLAGSGKLKEGYADGDDENKGFESYTEEQPDLRRHLEWQIEVGGFSLAEQKLAQRLLGYLDDKGYLTSALKEIWESDFEVVEAVKELLAEDKPNLKSFPEFDPGLFAKKYAEAPEEKKANQDTVSQEIEGNEELCKKVVGAPTAKKVPALSKTDNPEVNPALTQKAGRVLESLLARLRNLDPPGVFSRDLQECLLVQARAVFSPGALALRILEQHFTLFLKQDFLKLAKVEKVELAQILEAKDWIATLEPFPGRNFNADPVQTVIPDVYVFKIGGEFKVRLNQDNLPGLRISHYYQNLSDKMQKDYGKQKNKSDDSEVLTAQYLVEKIRAGEWLIKSIEQRQKTIVRVTESIIKRQGAFLEKGVEALKPMVLKDIAEDIGVHESTVSRITSQKYMHTPQGIFELKFFFTSGIQQDDGLFISSKKIKDLIQKMVAEESPKKPLTDSQLAINLDKKMGIKVARRTVAKYREALNIHPSNRRKRRF